MTHRSRRSSGFAAAPLSRRREPSGLAYLSERATFWIAVMSVFAFVTGNMLGQHGWHVFWKSVLGGMDDSLIAYTGTVAPIPKIPDPVRWAKYGGDFRAHTYDQAPTDLLIAYPTYAPFDRKPENDTVFARVYSVDYFGTYKTGAGEGSHPGIDMAAPKGTPVVAIANAEVVRTAEDAAGFGKYVVLRHPNVPDPADPRKTTTLYSLYGHLNSVSVIKGELVQKGKHIGTVGSTGDASGNHLHFQLQNIDSKWWPFTAKDASDAHMSFVQAVDAGLNRDAAMQYIVNPMLYVQANYAPVSGTAIVRADTPPKVTKARQTLADRIAARKARVVSIPVSVVSNDAPPAQSVSSSSVSSASPIVQSASSSSPTPNPNPNPNPNPISPQASTSQTIDHIEIQSSHTFSNREWQKVRLVLLDATGNVVRDPQLPRDLVLRTAYGKAEFKPSVLSSLDFRNGVAEIEMMGFGKTTIVPVVMPLNQEGKPIRFAER